MAYFSPNGMQSQSPVDLVRDLRSQGMDNNQIIQTLQKQGLSSNVIFDAMNQTDLNVPEPSPEQSNFQNYPQQSYPVFSQGTESISIKPRSMVSRDNTSNEELIEAIVEEKWNDLVKDLNKIIEWKNATSNKIAMLDQKIEDIRREFDKLHAGVIAKVDDYDKNILNVGAEVKAMEKVFSKVLPVFAENVSELSRIAKDIKRPAGRVNKE
jgi:DNA-binding winged helix-turn-helix (wHTH) protein